jgi:hypothetical protein
MGSMKYLLASGGSCNCWNNNCHKVVALHGMKAYVRRRGITSLINRSAYMEVSGQLYAPSALHPRKTPLVSVETEAAFRVGLTFWRREFLALARN